MSTTATFTVTYQQYLDQDGNITAPLPEFAQSAELLINLYQTMVYTRAFDSKAVKLQRTGKLGTYASTLGQEAIAAATGKAMAKEDVLAPFYRDYAAQLQRGVTMEELYSYWGGDERGNDYANNHDLPISIPIASQCLHAAGVATAFKLRKQARVAVTTIGDGGTSQGDFYEAMNVAGAWNLPLIFIINNNQWAISVPRDKQTNTQTLAQKAIAAGFSGEQVDGNDIIALYDVISRALTKARQGQGPTLIEAITYRLCDHTTADDASRYRPDTEVSDAWELEPIKRLRAYLNKQNLWDDAKEESLQEQAIQRVNQAVAAYTEKQTQPVEAIFDWHYADLPTALEEQRQQALDNAAKDQQDKDAENAEH